METLIQTRKQVFTKTFGGSNAMKVIEFLIQHKNEDFTISEISKGAGVGRTTLWEGDLLKRLADEGLIMKSREIGNAKLFRLNPNSEKAKLLINFYDKLKELRNAR